MKPMILIACLLLTGCQTPVKELCRHRVKSQHAAAVEKYGKENVQIWRLKNADQSTYRYHAQVSVRPNGVGTPWRWLPNRCIVEYLSDTPQAGCTPFERMK